MLSEDMIPIPHQPGTVDEFAGFSTEENGGARVEDSLSWYEDLVSDWDDFSANITPMPSLQSAPIVTESGVIQDNYMMEEIELADGKTRMSVFDRGMGFYEKSSPNALGIESLMEGRPISSPIQPIAKANSPTKAPTDMIGSVYSTANPNAYVFKCRHLACQGETFGRWYDLKRHHDGAHTLHGPAFWCHIAGCQRSAAAGGKPFPRKDKLRDHIRKVHTG